ncbi:MAG: PadR family transcriptional regulator [Clostridia bacterium]
MTKSICHGFKPHRMERFMEACLLMLLRESPAHGYVLAELLGRYGFSQEELSVSTLYRTLRNMEKQGLVSSFWEEGGQGPPKRVYEISSRGKQELDMRINTLAEKKARIEVLLEAYRHTGESK